jgi:hypothetical protein
MTNSCEACWFCEGNEDSGLGNAVEGEAKVNVAGVLLVLLDLL